MHRRAAYDVEPKQIHLSKPCDVGSSTHTGAEAIGSCGYVHRLRQLRCKMARARRTYLSPSVSAAVTYISSWPLSELEENVNVRTPDHDRDGGTWSEGGGTNDSRWVGKRKTILLGDGIINTPAL